jgi:iron complex transport system substrate-binding protein
LITLAGGINIAENETSQYVTLNSEYIIDKNPDIIIKFYYGTEPNEEEMNALKEEIIGRAGWDGINAVKEGKVYVINYAESSINPRLVIGLIRYAKWINPELFGDIDVEGIEEYIYSEIYGLTA